MKKILLFATVSLISVLLAASCSEKPKKRADLKPGEQVVVNTEYSASQDETDVEEVAETTDDETSEQMPVEGQDNTIEEAEEETVVDTHIYTAEELTDELIAEKVEGYWETGEFGYLRGYRFFESGFLQLVLQRKVNQTGIYMVRGGGIYFSLDSKTWDEDVLIIESIGPTELVGRFGEHQLILHRADETLVEENSGIVIDNSYDTGVIDAATEVENRAK